VELALRSGAALLVRDHDKGEAQLLLAESLSEQADWHAALTILENIDVPLSANQNAACIALHCVADCNLWRHDDTSIASSVADLVRRIAVIDEPFAIALVARALSSLALTDRGTALASRINTLLSGFNARMTQSHARQEWLLACIRVRYLLDDPKQLSDSMAALSAEMKSTKTKSSAAADLALGQGNSCCRQGDYSGAIVHFAHASELAAELGHQSMLACSAVNRALCFGALGQYDKQIEYAKVALKLEREYPNAYRRILARYNLALGHALRGERVEALMAIHELRASQVEVAPRWVNQIKQLYAADTLWLVGKRREARVIARPFVTGAFEEPASLSFAGHHSRWMALAGPDRRRALAALNQLMHSRGQLDKLDQAEVALAYAIVATELEESLGSSAQQEAMELLASLPPAITRIMGLFGLLPSTKKGAKAQSRGTIRQ
jgi:tetratricopeptide (TPR) repeat protein